ncbi:RIM8 [Candida theae]|uniref:pH-response regulator protein palF/RIM8 n=1 Tax=Candida theae TaxID=1198502 RepID=A0AAD5BIN0_9ASCO|nr:RIM8 [Candida theae]KAI5966684.1 RIM8 [Candida theae]
MRRAVSKILPSPSGGGGGGSSGSSSSNANSTSKLGASSFASAFKLDFSAVDEFYVQLDNPHKTWLPGDEVSGQIVLISKRNLANIVITLSLIGFIKINASSHSKLRPLKHTLFDHTIKIYGGSDNIAGGGNSNDEEFTNGLNKGEHVFPFIVKLPNKRVFTSIDFGKGSINYLLRACVGNASSFTTDMSNNLPTSPGELPAGKKKSSHSPSYTSEKLINLINPIDVSTLPRPKPKRLILKDPRGSLTKDKKLSRTQSSTSTLNTVQTFATMSSNNSDQNSINDQSSHSNSNELGHHHDRSTSSINKLQSTIKVILDVPQRGYLRGESIPVKLTINHLKKVQDLNGIIITFVRVCRLDNGPDGVVESFRKDLQQTVLPLYVDPVTLNSEVKTSLRVPPDAFPTITGCPLVSFQYFIEVLINLSGRSVNIDPDLVAERHSPDSNNNIQQPQQKSATSIESFQFNFNSTAQNQKDRSTFINTDRFKRSKKFLQLTSEICIGTHRSQPEDEDVQTLSSTEPTTTTVSRRSSSSISNSNLSPALFNSSGNPSPQVQTTSTNSPSFFGHTPTPLPSSLIATSGGVTNSAANSASINGPPSSLSTSAMAATNPPQRYPYINSIPEFRELNHFQTPPYSTNAEDSQAPLYSNDHATDISNEFVQTLHQNSGLSEKERMQQHEDSLLPSAPPDLDEEEDEEEDGEVRVDGVGPEGGNEAEDRQGDAPVNEPPSHNFGNNCTPPLPLEHGSENHISFFTFTQPTPPPSQPAQSSPRDSDNTINNGQQQQQQQQRSEFDDYFGLPSSSSTSEHHDAPSSSLAHQLFNDDEIDHVPAYVSAKDDQLLSQSHSHLLHAGNASQRDQQQQQQQQQQRQDGELDRTT